MLRLILALAILPVSGFGQSRRLRMIETFDAEAFGAHQADGRTVVVHFHSQSCQLCSQQEAVLKEYAAEKDPTTPAFFQADVDANQGMTLLYSAKPSTILVFRGRRLVGKQTGMTSGEKIRELVATSLMKSRGRPSPRPKREFKPKR